DPRAQALLWFNVGRAQEELSLYDEAIASFERYLADAPSDAPFREQTLDRLRELRARVARSGSTAGHEPAATGGPSPLLVTGAVVGSVGALALLASVPLGLVALDNRSELEQV